MLPRKKQYSCILLCFQNSIFFFFFLNLRSLPRFSNYLCWVLIYSYYTLFQEFNDNHCCLCSYKDAGVFQHAKHSRSNINDTTSKFIFLGNLLTHQPQCIAIKQQLLNPQRPQNLSRMLKLRRAGKQKKTHFTWHISVLKLRLYYDGTQSKTLL